MTFKVAAYAFRMRRGGGGAAIRQPHFYLLGNYHRAGA